MLVKQSKPKKLGQRVKKLVELIVKSERGAKKAPVKQNPIEVILRCAGDQKMKWAALRLFFKSVFRFLEVMRKTREKFNQQTRQKRPWR